jgi:hypothetical protein
VVQRQRTPVGTATILRNQSVAQQSDRDSYQTTVVIRPTVHWVLPVTYSVHWVGCSFLGNHGRITIYGSPAIAGPKFLTLFCLFWTEILAVTVTNAKVWGPATGTNQMSLCACLATHLCLSNRRQIHFKRNSSGHKCLETILKKPNWSMYAIE